MKQIHQLLFQMLCEIDDICRKHGITYYTAGGTTLGAVRHDGFIPWDDDADIYMTRDEFDRFRLAFKEESPKDRELECLEDNPEYPATIPRYVNTATTNVARFNILDTCAAGLVIDIFILDPVPEDPEEQRRRRNLFNVYSEFVNPYYGFSYRCDDDFLGEYWKYLDKAKKHGVESVRKELEEILFTYPEEECRYYMLRWATVPHVFPKDMMGNPVYMKYEGRDLPHPERWYDYLVLLYGLDWYMMPKNTGDEGHVVVTNLNVPYETYMQDAKKYIDADEIKELLIERKGNILKYTEMRRPYLNMVLQTKSDYIRHVIRRRIEQCGKTLADLYENGEYEEILDIYSEYMTAQLSQGFIGAKGHTSMYRLYNPVYIKLEEEEYYFLIKTIIAKGDIKKALTILEISKKAGASSDRIDELEEHLNHILQIMKEYYSGERDRAYHLIGSLPDEFAGNAMIQGIRTQMAGEKDEITEDELVTISVEYDDPPEIKKALADYCLANGEPDRASALYSEILQTTNNGMLIKDIRNRCGTIREETQRQDSSPEKSPATVEGIKDKYLEMLIEFDQICKREGIDYTLSGKTLLYAEKTHRFPSAYKVPTVMMNAKNAKKLVKAFEDNEVEGRTLLHMGNSNFMHELIMWYCDTGTTWINLSREAFNNMHIRIIVLEQLSANRVRATLENWIEKTGYLDATLNNPTVENPKGIKGMIAIAGSGVVKKLCGGKDFHAKNLERKLDKDYEGRDYVVLKNDYGRHPKFKLPYEIMESFETVELYGYRFPAISEWRQYIKAAFGKYALDSIEPFDNRYRSHVIVNPDEPLEDALDVIGTDIIHTDEKKSYDDSYKHSISNRKLTKQSRRAFRVFERTDARILLAEKYVPIKDRIISLAEKGDIGELNALLEDYDRQARKFNKKGLAIYFDEDIFRAYLMCLEADGEEDYIEKIRKNIDKDQLEPLAPDYVQVRSNN